MQTFLPFESFKASAQSLDRARLGKQRVENLQIMTALHEGSRWENHPAVKMWRGYECALLVYQASITKEWTARGYKDTCFMKTMSVHNHAECLAIKPWWLGDPKFHEAMRSRLIQKNREFYEPQFPGTPDNLGYLWPSGGRADKERSFRNI